MPKSIFSIPTFIYDYGGIFIYRQGRKIKSIVNYVNKF
jgi:hypothetical protein